jgi:FkbM family methyltransferase
VGVRETSKSLALRMLPDSLLHFIKRVHYERVLRSASEADERDLLVLRHLVEPGQFVADLGANIGVYAKYLSECVGPSGRVIGVEPIPPTFDILRSNVRKLGLTNVELKNCAISDAEGQVRMRVPRYDSGGENFYGARIDEGGVDDSFRSFVVPTTTIDALLLGASRVQFIKCDVEGHELNCIRGAVNTIKHSAPAWLIEISGDMEDQRSGSHEVYRILHNNGYEAYWFDGTKLKRRVPGTKSVNYFFLTDPQVERLRQKGFAFEH